MKGSKWSARPLGKAHGNLEVMTWLLPQVIRPHQPIKERKLSTIARCHEQVALSYLPWWGWKIMTLGPSFIIFGTLEDLLKISKGLTNLGEV
jgi:hypothetical protein